VDWGVFGGGLSNVVVLWGARRGWRQQSIKLFLDQLVNVRKQDGYWLIDFWNGFGEYPINPYKPAGYGSIEIKLQRLAQQMTGEEGIATDAEALAYVSNASLAVPLAYEWVEIYQYLLTR
jgi:hypothetical protein